MESTVVSTRVQIFFPGKGNTVAFCETIYQKLYTRVLIVKKKKYKEFKNIKKNDVYTGV